jgi:hypothetical protein
MAQQRTQRGRQAERPSNGRQEFYNVQMRLVIAGQAESISLCGRCAALVLASERSQRLHRAYHEQVDGHDPR